MKRTYQVGEPCDDCGTPTIQGKNGYGYCKPCYIKWKNSKEQLPPSNQGAAPVNRTGNFVPRFAGSDLLPILKEIDRKLGVLIELYKNAYPEAAKLHEDQLDIPTVEERESFDPNNIPF
jgi:hypothetical protein